MRYGICAVLVSMFLSGSIAGGAEVYPDKPNAVEFPAVDAKFVRFAIRATSGSQNVAHGMTR